MVQAWKWPGGPAQTATTVIDALAMQSKLLRGRRLGAEVGQRGGDVVGFDSGCAKFTGELLRLQLAVGG